jgi:hypothetical protein
MPANVTNNVSRNDGMPIVRISFISDLLMTYFLSYNKAQAAVNACRCGRSLSGTPPSVLTADSYDKSFRIFVQS